MQELAKYMRARVLRECAMVKVSCCTSQLVRKVDLQVLIFVLCWVFSCLWKVIELVLDIRNAYLVLSYNMNGMDHSPIRQSFKLENNFST